MNLLHIRPRGTTRPTRRLVAALAIVLVGTFALQSLAAAATVVTSGNLGVDWFITEQRAGSTAEFAAGPGVPAFGSGSFQMTMQDGAGKVTLFTYNHVGTALAEISALGIATYRSSASTNPVAQYPSLNIEVDFVGDGSSFTTLVFEPVYNSAGLALDTWQVWDAYAGGAAVWWSTKDIPGVCAFNCFVSWSTIVANNPNAKISGGFGTNVGSGWDGFSSTAADGLTINGTTYDLEPSPPVIGPPVSKDECKNGGWQQFNTPRVFKNQGDCIQFVNTGK
jgi:hypothetical protein